MRAPVKATGSPIGGSKPRRLCHNNGADPTARVAGQPVQPAPTVEETPATEGETGGEGEGQLEVESIPQS